MGGFYAEAARLYRAAGEPYLEAPFEGMAAFMRPGRAAWSVRAARRPADGHARRARAAALPLARAAAVRRAGSPPTPAPLRTRRARPSRSFPTSSDATGVHHVEGGMGALVRRSAAPRSRRLGVELRLGTAPAAAVVARRARALVRRRRGAPLRRGGGERATRSPLTGGPSPSRSRCRATCSCSRPTAAFRSRTTPSASRPTTAREFDELFSGRLAEDPTVYFCHPAATDPTMAPEGKSGLFVMANAPAIDAAAGDDEWAVREQTLREQCLAAARAVVGPGVGLTVLAERTPRDLERLGAPGGSIYGFLPHGKFGPFRRPRIRGAAARPVLRGRRHPPRRRRAAGDALRALRRPARLAPPRRAAMSLALPPLPGPPAPTAGSTPTSSPGDYTCVCIFMLGAPFSAKYSARSRAGGLPLAAQRGEPRALPPRAAQALGALRVPVGVDRGRAG